MFSLSPFLSFINGAEVAPETATEIATMTPLPVDPATTTMTVTITTMMAVAVVLGGGVRGRVEVGTGTGMTGGAVAGAVVREIETVDPAVVIMMMKIGM